MWCVCPGEESEEGEDVEGEQELVHLFLRDGGGRFASSTGGWCRLTTTVGKIV